MSDIKKIGSQEAWGGDTAESLTPPEIALINYKAVIDQLKQQAQELKTNSPKPQGLDIGGATGHGAKYLTQELNIPFIYTEPNTEMYKKALALHSGETDLAMIPGDSRELKNLLRRNSIDIVTALMVVQFIPNPEQFAQNIHAILKPGGIICMHNFSIDWVQTQAQQANFEGKWINSNDHLLMATEEGYTPIPLLPIDEYKKIFEEAGLIEKSREAIVDDGWDKDNPSMYFTTYQKLAG